LLLRLLELLFKLKVLGHLHLISKFEVLPLFPGLFRLLVLLLIDDLLLGPEIIGVKHLVNESVERALLSKVLIVEVRPSSRIDSHIIALARVFGQYLAEDLFVLGVCKLLEERLFAEKLWLLF